MCVCTNSNTRAGGQHQSRTQRHQRYSPLHKRPTPSPTLWSLEDSNQETGYTKSLFHLSSHNVKYHTLPQWKNIFWVAPSAPTGTLQVQLVTIVAICLYSSAVNWTPHKPGAWTSTNTRVTPQTIWNAQQCWQLTERSTNAVSQPTAIWLNIHVWSSDSSTSSYTDNISVCKTYVAY